MYMLISLSYYVVTELFVCFIIFNGLNMYQIEEDIKVVHKVS